LRPSEQIALLVSDFDPTHGTLEVNKACVGGIDKDSTKTGEDRRIELCPRALQVLNRQLAFRDALARLPSIRYRKPYCARHSSVSWNLMTGRRPLWVAKQHGHSSITTMLSVYAAWTDDASETDLDVIKRALSAAPRETAQRPAVPMCTAINAAGPTVIPARVATTMTDRPPNRRLALDLALAGQCETQLPDNWWKILAEREGFELKMILSLQIPRNLHSCLQTCLQQSLSLVADPGDLKARTSC